MNNVQNQVKPGGCLRGGAHKAHLKDAKFFARLLTMAIASRCGDKPGACSTFCRQTLC
jgi:hypothetical protein